jgi:hypothetical protein
VDLSGLKNLHTLHLTSHNVESICHTLASLPPTSAQTLRVLEVAFASWIYYYDLPCPCDPAVLVFDFAGVMQGDNFSRLTRFHIRVPEFFGEAGRNTLKEYFPRWRGTQVLRVGYIDKSRPVELEEMGLDIPGLQINVFRA